MCLVRDNTKCCSYYGPLPTLNLKQWEENGKYWHVPKFGRKVSVIEKKINKMMSSDKITCNSCSDELISFSSANGDFDVSNLINQNKITLDTSLMIGAF